MMITCLAAALKPTEIMNTHPEMVMLLQKFKTNKLTQYLTEDPLINDNKQL